MSSTHIPNIIASIKESIVLENERYKHDTELHKKVIRNLTKMMDQHTIRGHPIDSPKLPKYPSFCLINQKGSNIALLTEMMNDLHSKAFIDKIEIASFRKVFLGKTIDKPINWIDNLPTLRYFVNCLRGKDKDEKEIINQGMNITEKTSNISNKLKNTTSGIWVITSKCFRVKGNEYDHRDIGKADLSEANPSRKQELKNIVQQLKD
jgi:hypothetical protein